MVDTIQVHTTVGGGGRVVIPGRFRKALGLAPGDSLVLILEGDSIRMLTPQAAIRQAQALVRSYVAVDRCLSDELIEERRDDG